MTLTRQERHKARIGAVNRERLQATLLAMPEPPGAVKEVVVADQRALVSENNRLRATLMTIGSAPEVPEDKKATAYDEYRKFARESLRRVTR